MSYTYTINIFENKMEFSLSAKSLTNINNVLLLQTSKKSQLTKIYFLDIIAS